MGYTKFALLIGTLAVSRAGLSCAQQPAPEDCHLSADQVKANKQVAAEFYRPGITPEQRLALIDPSYVQHNPRFVEAAARANVSAYEEFKQMFSHVPQPAPADASKPTAPANALVIVMGECDLVTLVRKNVLPNPNTPGATYDAYSFDTFRVRNGRLVEHWDGATLNPPAANGTAR